MTKALFASLACLLALSQTAYPAGLRIAFMDSFATGRGNAFAATADNPSAIFYNPAGLTQLERNELSAGAYAIRFSSEHTAPNGERTDMRDAFTPVPHFYYAHNMPNAPFAFGVGVYVPFGLVTDWPDDGPFSQLATRSELTYTRVNPVASYQITPRLSVGGGPTFNSASIDLRRRPVIFGEEHRYRLEGDDSALGFNAGVHWQPLPGHAFGLSYHSPTEMRFRGSDSIRGAFVNQSGKASIDRLTLPEIAIVGYSYRPTPEWNLEINIDWTNWDRFDSTTIRSGLGDEHLPLNWDSTFIYGAGVTRYLAKSHFLSAGYAYAENAVPAETFNPFLPDSRLHFVSIGFGSTDEPFTWQAGYHYGFGPSRDIPGMQANGSDGSGSYEAHLHSITFTFVFNF